MSSVICDMVDGYGIIGAKLNDFLYEGKVKNNIKKEHSKEELEDIIEEIRLEAWDNYRIGSDSLGWGK